MAILTLALLTTQDFTSGSFMCDVPGCGLELDEVDNSKDTDMIDAWCAVLRSVNLGPSLPLAPALTLSPHPNHSSPSHDTHPKPRRAELRNTFAQLHAAVRDADAYPPPIFKMPPKEPAEGAALGHVEITLEPEHRRPARWNQRAQ